MLFFPVFKGYYFNPLLTDKILDHLTKVKVFADGKTNEAQMMVSVFNWVKKNCGFQNSPISNNIFKRPHF